MEHDRRLAAFIDEVQRLKLTRRSAIRRAAALGLGAAAVAAHLPSRHPARLGTGETAGPALDLGRRRRGGGAANRRRRGQRRRRRPSRSSPSRTRPTTTPGCRRRSPAATRPISSGSPRSTSPGTPTAARCSTSPTACAGDAGPGRQPGRLLPVGDRRPPSTTDKTWGLPWISQPVILYYNPDLFSAAGVAPPDDTWTWDTFKQAAAQLTDPADGRLRHQLQRLAADPDVHLAGRRRGDQRGSRLLPDRLAGGDRGRPVLRRHHLQRGVRAVGGDDHRAGLRRDGEGRQGGDVLRRRRRRPRLRPQEGPGQRGDEGGPGAAGTGQPPDLLLRRLDGDQRRTPRTPTPPTRPWSPSPRASTTGRSSPRASRWPTSTRSSPACRTRPNRPRSSSRRCRTCAPSASSRSSRSGTPSSSRSSRTRSTTTRATAEELAPDARAALEDLLPS